MSQRSEITINDTVVVDWPKKPAYHRARGRVLAFSGSEDEPRAVLLLDSGESPVLPLERLVKVAR